MRNQGGMREIQVLIRSRLLQDVTLTMDELLLNQHHLLMSEVILAVELSLLLSEQLQCLNLLL